MQSILVSIHDVMPETLDPVDRLLAVVGDNGLDKITLLVVPGRNWQAADIDRLRAWHDAGCRFAGHGWCHRCDRIRNWQHRLHSLILSRDVAEHLAATPEQCARIVARCAQWFADCRLPQPVLYVPPAWALGRMSLETLRQLPFPLFETQTGVIDADLGVMYRLPLAGYEADTLLRQWVLRCLNGMNTAASLGLGRPLRLALHPHDLSLRLSGDVRAILARNVQAIDYGDLRSLIAIKPLKPETTGDAGAAGRPAIRPTRPERGSV